MCRQKVSGMNGPVSMIVFDRPQTLNSFELLLGARKVKTYSIQSGVSR